MDTTQQEVWQFIQELNRAWTIENNGGRDMFSLVKEDGRWWAVADQFSPFP